MLETIAIAIAITCAFSVLIILSLVLTAPRDPEPEQTPFTQAIIDQVTKFETVCTCFHRDLTPEDITHYVTTDGGAVWAVYQKCPIHKVSATSPVWSPGIGTLRDEATAGTVAVEIGV